MTQALKTLEQSLKKVVFGQNDAVESVVSAVKLARSGLRHAEKPMAASSFLAPQALAKRKSPDSSANPCHAPIRFDVSNIWKSTVWPNLLAPLQGMGFEKGGLLTEAVTKNPYAILLLDEIEKAHPDVYNVLLQLMDYGFVTDPQGRCVIFAIPC